ncbi:MAG: hypothetical protein K9M08_19420 [Pirellula sp.]|nr:hypothetical protein [Pirellula sp.]
MPDADKGPTVWVALPRHDVFSVDQLSSTDQSVSEERLGQSFYTDDQSVSEERLGQSFYTMVDDVADRIADESEIRRGKQFVLEQIG